jgi:hypothetical protein
MRITRSRCWKVFIFKSDAFSSFHLRFHHLFHLITPIIFGSDWLRKTVENRVLEFLNSNTFYWLTQEFCRINPGEVDSSPLRSARLKRKYQTTELTSLHHQKQETYNYYYSTLEKGSLFEYMYSIYVQHISPLACVYFYSLCLICAPS